MDALPQWIDDHMEINALLNEGQFPGGVTIKIPLQTDDKSSNGNQSYLSLSAA
jgi:hypothetical protein